MNFQKWELFSGSPGILYDTVFLNFANICCCSSSCCGAPIFKLIHVFITTSIIGSNERHWNRVIFFFDLLAFGGVTRLQNQHKRRMQNSICKMLAKHDKISYSHTQRFPRSATQYLSFGKVHFSVVCIIFRVILRVSVDRSTIIKSRSTGKQETHRHKSRIDC